MTRIRLQISQTEVSLCVLNETIGPVEILQLFNDLQVSTPLTLNLTNPLTASTPVELRFRNCQFLDNAFRNFNFAPLSSLRRIELKDCNVTTLQIQQLISQRLRLQRLIDIHVEYSAPTTKERTVKNVSVFNLWLQSWRQHWWIELSTSADQTTVEMVREYQNYLDKAVQIQLDFHTAAFTYSELELAIFEQALWSQWQENLKNLLQVIKQFLSASREKMTEQVKMILALSQDLLKELEIYDPQIRDPAIKQQCKFNYFIFLANYRMLRHCVIDSVVNENPNLLLEDISSYLSLHKHAKEFFHPNESPSLKWVRIVAVAFFYQVLVILSKVIDKETRESLNKIVNPKEFIEFLSALSQIRFTPWENALLYEVSVGVLNCFEKLKQIYLTEESRFSQMASYKALETLGVLLTQGGNAHASKLVACMLLKKHHGGYPKTCTEIGLDYLVSLDDRLMKLFANTALLPKVTTVCHDLECHRYTQYQMVEQFYCMLFNLTTSIQQRSRVAQKMANPPQSRLNMPKQFLKKYPMGLDHVEPFKVQVDLPSNRCSKIYSLNKIWSTNVPTYERHALIQMLMKTLPTKKQIIDDYLSRLKSILAKPVPKLVYLLFDLHAPIAGFCDQTLEVHQNNVVLMAFDIVRLIAPLMSEQKTFPGVTQLNKDNKHQLTEYSKILKWAAEYSEFLINTENRPIIEKIVEDKWPEFKKLIEDVYARAIKALDQLTELFIEYATQIRQFGNSIWQSEKKVLPQPQQHFVANKRTHKKIAPPPKIKTPEKKPRPMLAVRESEEIDQNDPEYFSTYPVLKRIQKLLEKNAHKKASEIARLELDRLIVENVEYPLMAYLCYVLADCQRLQEGKELNSNTNQFSRAAFEYLSQGYHYVELTKEAGLTEDPDLLKIFAFLEQEVEQCAYFHERVKPVPEIKTKALNTSEIHFSFPEKLQEFIRLVAEIFPLENMYGYGSTATAAVYHAIFPTATPLQVGDFDLVVFVDDLAAGCLKMEERFSRFRRTHYLGLYRGNYGDIKLDILLIDARIHDPKSFVEGLNLRCKALLIKMDGLILDLSGLAIEQIRNKTVQFMPGICLQTNQIALLNHIHAQVAYSFSGDSDDKDKIIANVNLLYAVEPFVLRNHFAKHYLNGHAKKALEVWDKHHLFSVLLPTVFATRVLLHDQYLNVCEQCDTQFAQSNSPRWCTVLNLLALFLKVVIANALSHEIVEKNVTVDRDLETKQVVESVVFKSNAILLNGLSIFEKFAICRLAGFTQFAPQNGPPGFFPDVSQDTTHNLPVPIPDLHRHGSQFPS